MFWLCYSFQSACVLLGQVDRGFKNRRNGKIAIGLRILNFWRVRKFLIKNVDITLCRLHSKRRVQYFWLWKFPSNLQIHWLRQEVWIRNECVILKESWSQYFETNDFDTIPMLNEIGNFPPIKITSHKCSLLISFCECWLFLEALARASENSFKWLLVKFRLCIIVGILADLFDFWVAILTVCYFVVIEDQSSVPGYVLQSFFFLLFRLWNKTTTNNCHMIFIFTLSALL